MKKLIIYLFLLLLIAGSTFAQITEKPGKLNHYSFAMGLGWTHYINTLEIGKDNATINSPGLSLRFFWEPEHRLSLGLETGYYRLYKVTNKSYSDLTGKVTMSAVPLMLTVRMRIIDRLYLSTGAGLAVMLNNVSGIDSEISSTILSMSNYQFSASYIRPLTRKLQAGAEFKFYNFGKTADWIYGLQLFCAVRL
jgi:hypothetical protein